MRTCLCCGKPLKNENGNPYHDACLMRFFGTKALPEIVLDSESLESLALKNASEGLSVPGVQKKLSLHLSIENKRSRLTLVDYPTGYILKPQVDDYESLPELEWLSMRLADLAGISTVPHALVRINDEYAYLSKRIDRRIENLKMKKIAMEDFCQLDLRLTEDKYHGSYERCAKIISKHSSRPGIDLSELFVRVVFSYIIGNSDMHLKNLSLIETKEGNGIYVLSPAYDLLAVNVVLPEDDEEFALTLNGKKKHITKNDFYSFGSHCGLSKTSCQKMMKRLCSFEDEFISEINNSVLNKKWKTAFTELVKRRCSALK